MFSFISNKKKNSDKNLDNIDIEEDKIDDINYLEYLLEKVEDSIIKLDKNIDYQNPNHEIITDRLFYIKKLKIFLGLNLYKLKNNKNYENNQRLDKLIEKLNNIKKNIDLIDDFNSQLSDKKRNSSLDTLTRVNTIFLPLTLIVGYFGMNFQSMGAPSNKTGIFTLKYGQGFVFFLMLISIVFIFILIKIDIISI